MDKSKVIVIAEAGVNHNGSLALAKQLVDAASESGADYVKFQTFNASKLATKYSEKAKYQTENMDSKGGSQLDMLKKLELSHQDHFELVNYCKTKKIGFFSTAFDLESIDFLNQIGLDFWKIPSGEITNYPYLKKIAQMNGHVIMSTGMCDMHDVQNAFDVLIKNGKLKDDITILHCNTEYPTPFKDVNLRAMRTIKSEFGINVGYSDHTLGIEIPIAAVAMGATIIEKHFTLDRTMDGPDHKASLEPDELKLMVSSIRNFDLDIGDGIKKVSESERKNIEIARKSIVASKKINKGDIFTEDNLTVKRPGTGISPMLWEQVIGKIADQNFEEDGLIICEL